MRTLPVDPVDPDERVIRSAVAVLREGGIVAYPTETYYGLAVDARNPAACAKIFRLKGRSGDKALPCILASAGELDSVAERVTPLARALARHFWPGPLTLVVQAGPGLAVRAGDGSIAVRVSGLVLARRLSGAFGSVLTATSANRSGSAPPTSAETVAADLGDGVDLLLDGGSTPGGLPSTIVDARGSSPILVREGAIPFASVVQAANSSKS